MTFPVQMAAISGDAVIGIAAVAIWIWLSVMGKRSRTDRPAPPAGGQSQPRDPQSELRKFFETLEKGLTVPTEEAEPPATPAGAFHPAPIPTPPPVPRKAPRPPPVRAVVLPPPPMAVVPPPLAAAAPLDGVSDLKPGPGLELSPRPALAPFRMEALRSREGLRHAIVAAEILGPPLSMRKLSPDAGHQ
jgi:hypothetical protein